MKTFDGVEIPHVHYLVMDPDGREGFVSPQDVIPDCQFFSASPCIPIQEDGSFFPHYIMTVYHSKDTTEYIVPRDGVKIVLGSIPNMPQDSVLRIPHKMEPKPFLGRKRDKDHDLMFIRLELEGCNEDALYEVHGQLLTGPRHLLPE